MYFKNLKDLVTDVGTFALTLGGQFDCVVGIPRSGMLVANLLALKLNLPMGDLDGLVNGRLLAMGRRFDHLSVDEFLAAPRRVLVVDDSIASGNALERAKKKLEGLNVAHEITFAAVYVTPAGSDKCDLYQEVIPSPRRFEWNILSDAMIANYCFDLDGVLCTDPTSEENDDGERYREFILNAKPLFTPKHTIGAIVTSRLEKYRKETEAWLASHGIKYERLEMLNLETKQDRMRTQAAPKFKADFYKRSDAELFVESDYNQAIEISKLSGKFVFSIENAVMHEPGRVLPVILRHKMTTRRRIRRLMNKLKLTYSSRLNS